MLNQLRPALVTITFFTLVTGLCFPLAVTGLGQALFPAQADGSLVRRGETVVGSALIGQNFASDRYFWPRPSATGPEAYNASASSGSNLGTTSVKLRDRVTGEVQRLREAGVAGAIPADAATTSGSGLDPHISPEFAAAQVDRVARTRGLEPEALRAIVLDHIDNRALGFIGEPRVNVLELNLALDALKS
ncbi:K+-transporting ATPase ATPase C chain [Rhizobium subbaraonis]|uniref:Potassium-transporting ATPase KdpC subunit n=1 Tax=Rhizobium subbaraonis TaxID=908946 RepID=A0A285U9K5_9HYPH|nr:potassium-transporting ATPase subunit KdpC [Rhizobium subbaraonis]SOC38512.1 K+-transporting ATPase ATPase C chain [Rhizobium subbaraonis]